MHPANYIKRGVSTHSPSPPVPVHNGVDALRTWLRLVCGAQAAGVGGEGACVEEPDDALLRQEQFEDALAVLTAQRHLGEGRREGDAGKGGVSAG